MGYNVAVCGATGNVGREMLNILAERLFPVDELTALASRRSLGTECSFGDKVLTTCLLYTSPSPRDATLSRMPSSA